MSSKNTPPATAASNSNSDNSNSTSTASKATTTMDKQLDTGATDSGRFDSGFQSTSFSSFANTEELLQFDENEPSPRQSPSFSPTSAITIDKTALDSGLCSDVIEDVVVAPPLPIVQQQQQQAPIPEQYKSLWKLCYAQVENGNTQLHIAVERRMQTACTNIIRLTPDARLLDVRNDDGQTALHAAVLTRQPHLVRQLRAAGARTAIRDHAGNTALHLACFNADLGSLRALTETLAAGGETHGELVGVLEQVNYEGSRCVHIAARQSATDMLRHLVHVCDADVNAREHLGGYTPLHIACDAEDLQLIEFMLAEFASKLQLETQTYGQLTAYLLAAHLSRDAIMERLFRAGAKELQLPAESSDSESEADDESDDDSERAYEGRVQKMEGLSLGLTGGGGVPPIRFE